MDAPARLPQNFTQLIDRSSPAPIIASSWCPYTDLVASINASNQLLIHRLSFELLFSVQIEDDTDYERVVNESMSDQPESTLITVCWRPDGKAIAVGSVNGSIFVISMEKRVVIYTYKVHETSINHLSWESYQVIDQTNNKSIKLVDRTKIFFPPLPSINQSNNQTGPVSYSAPDEKINPFGIHIDGDSFKQSNFIVSGDANGFVHVRMFGTMSLLHIDVQSLISKQSNNQSNNQSVSLISCAPSSDFTIIQSILSSSDHSSRIVNLITPSINQSINEFTFLACQQQHVNYLIRYIDQSIEQMTTRWKSINQSINMKFSPMKEYIEEAWAIRISEKVNLAIKQSLDNPNQIIKQSIDPSFIQSINQPTPKQDLLSALYTGVSSDSLNQFITRLIDASAMTRQQTNIESTIVRLIDQSKICIKPAIEQLLFRINQMRGIARYQSINQSINLSVNDFDHLFDITVEMNKRNDSISQSLINQRKCYSAFYTWFIQLAREISDESNNQSNNQSINHQLVAYAIENVLFGNTSIYQLINLQLTPFDVPPSLPLDQLALSGLRQTLTQSFDRIYQSVNQSVNQTVTIDCLIDVQSTQHDDFPSMFDPAINQSIRREMELPPLNQSMDQHIRTSALVYQSINQSNIHRSAFVVTHPLLQYPVIAVLTCPLPPNKLSNKQSINQPTLAILSCPGLTSMSRATIQSIDFSSINQLIVLVRYAVNRRSSEIQALHQRERMIGNIYSRLWSINLANPDDEQSNTIHIPLSYYQSMNQSIDELIIPHIDSNPSIFSMDTVGVRALCINPLNTETNNQTINQVMDVPFRQRCFYGLSLRSFSSNHQRGVGALLFSALSADRIKQSMKRMMLMDMADDEETEESINQSNDQTDEQDEEMAE